jgi:hypothetical protein
MTRTVLFSLIIGFLGLGCLVLFAVIGSHVDENGILREPFFLLPLGYLLMLAGFGAVLVLFVRRRFRSHRRR